MSAPNEAVEMVSGDDCVGGLGELDEGHVLLMMKYFDSKYVSVKAKKVKKLKSKKKYYILQLNVTKHYEGLCYLERKMKKNTKN